MCILKYTEKVLNQSLFSKYFGKLRERSRILIAEMVCKVSKHFRSTLQRKDVVNFKLVLRELERTIIKLST